MSPASMPHGRVGGNVRPFRQHRLSTLAVRLYSVRATLDNGEAIELQAASVTAGEVEEEVYRQARQRGRFVRRHTTRCLGRWPDTDGEQGFVHTVPPELADEVSEALASRPSPFDAQASKGRPDDDFPNARWEHTLHQAAEGLMRAERARLWAIRDHVQASDDALAHIPPPATPTVPPWMAPANAWPEQAHRSPDDDPGDWLYSLRHTETRHRVVLALSFVVAICSALWAAGVLG